MGRRNEKQTENRRISSARFTPTTYPLQSGDWAKNTTWRKCLQLGNLSTPVGDRRHVVYRSGGPHGDGGSTVGLLDQTCALWLWRCDGGSVIRDSEVGSNWGTEFQKIFQSLFSVRSNIFHPIRCQGPKLALPTLFYILLWFHKKNVAIRKSCANEAIAIEDLYSSIKGTYTISLIGTFKRYAMTRKTPERCGWGWSHGL